MAVAFLGLWEFLLIVGTVARVANRPFCREYHQTSH
jgi:hypothetical protein